MYKAVGLERKNERKGAYGTSRLEIFYSCGGVEKGHRSRSDCNCVVLASRRTRRSSADRIFDQDCITKELSLDLFVASHFKP